MALGFSRLDNLTVINGIGIPLMNHFSNLFAIAYIFRTRDFMRVHRERARRVMETYARDMAALNKSIRWPEKPFYRNRTFIQVSLHILLIITALLPTCVYLKILS